MQILEETNSEASHPQGEIILYQPEDKISIEVKIGNDTVWLTQQQMSELYQKDRTVITRHINNIFKEGELEEKSNVQILHFTFSDKPIKFYNLDVIISVGYRVKSQRGTQFRRWATSVLKEYLLRGYSVNQQLMYVEERIDRRLSSVEKTLAKHQEKIDFFVRTNLPPVEQVFFKGQFFEARVLLERLIKLAQNRVVVIDKYIDAETFEILDVRQKGVTADIFSGSIYTNLRDNHNATAGIEPINTHRWKTASHDRWLIIDDHVYHCGHLLKDMGKKLSAITLMGISPKVIIETVE